MTDFIVEDGSGKVDATTLVSLQYADQYFSVHPFYADAWSEMTEERRKNLLIFSSRYTCDLVAFPGEDLVVGQAFPFPRSGTMFGTTVIPDALKRAICEMAYILSTPAGNPNAGSSAGVEELKVDVITIKFAGATTAQAIPATVLRLLRSVAGASNGGRVRRVQVGLA